MGAWIATVDEIPSSGDPLLTGTPGAAVVEDGDVAGCRIDGFPELRNRVRRTRGTG